MELKVDDEYAQQIKSNACSEWLVHPHIGMSRHVLELLDDRSTMLAEIKRLTEDNVLLDGDLGRMSIENDGLTYQHKDDIAEIARLRAEVEKIEKAERAWVVCDRVTKDFMLLGSKYEVHPGEEDEERIRATLGTRETIRPFALVPVEDKPCDDSLLTYDLLNLSQVDGTKREDKP